jgi:hypothetical protein
VKRDDLPARDDVVDLKARIGTGLLPFTGAGLQALALGDTERITCDDAARIELEVSHALPERPAELLRGWPPQGWPPCRAERSSWVLVLPSTARATPAAAGATTLQTTKLVVAIWIFHVDLGTPARRLAGSDGLQTLRR